MARTKKVKETELDMLPVMSLMTVLIPVLITMAAFEKLAIVQVFLDERSDTPNNVEPPPIDQSLNLTVAIGSDYLMIGASGGFEPMIFYREMWTFRCKVDNDTITYDPRTLSKDNPPTCRNGTKLDSNYIYSIETIHLWALNKQSEEDPGTLLTGLYSASDSAYINPGDNQFVGTKDGIGPGTQLATLSPSSVRTLNGEAANEAKVRNLSAYDMLAKTLVPLHANAQMAELPDADNILIVADDNTQFDKIISVMDRARAAGFYKINLSKLQAGG
jgi:biopolymer transport protein ExbD